MIRWAVVVLLLTIAALHGDVRAQQVPGQMPGCGSGVATNAFPGAQIPAGCGPELPNNPNNNPGPPPTCGVGAMDLSTGCAQLMAIGVLF